MTEALGAPLDRIDGTAKTTGVARYSTDYPHNEVAYAALVHATIARGRITDLDAATAIATPGVIAVLTHLNAPRLKPTGRRSMFDLPSLAPGTTVNYLNTDEVYFDGQPVAVVVAETIDIAAEAAALIDVSYQSAPSRVDLAAALTSARRVRPSPVGGTMGGAKGDAATALVAAQNSAEKVWVDLNFTTPEQSHNALEPHATTARWDGAGAAARLTVWDGTQNLEWTARHLAAKFGLKRRQVRVISPQVGGGFGGRSWVWPHTVLAVMAARVTGRPIRLMLTREGVYRTVGGRTATVQRLALAADREGRLEALIHQVTTRTSAIGGWPEQVVSCSAELYAVPHLLLEQQGVRLDLVPNSLMRAPGEAVGTFALESAMDQLAHELRIDPVELRLRNQPTRNPLTGNEFSHRMAGETLRLGAQRFGWSQRSPQPGSMLDGRHHIGWGCASAIHPDMRFNANLTLRLDPDDRLTVRCGFHDLGMGTPTVTTQLAAQLMNLPVEQVVVEYGDSTLPIGPGAGASAQTSSIAAALISGCTDLSAQLKQAGRIRARPLVARVGADTGVRAGIGTAKMMARLMRDGRRWSKAASGAHFCEVRIDADTGEIRVTRWLGVFDIGRVVNPKLAASQLRGAIVMGLGLALTEATLVDPRTGRIMNPSLTGYQVPVAADVPVIEVVMLDDPDPQLPLGVLGAGEVGITGVGSAVANAVFHATGRRVLNLPITLDTVLP